MSAHAQNRAIGNGVFYRSQHFGPPRPTGLSLFFGSRLSYVTILLYDYLLQSVNKYFYSAQELYEAHQATTPYCKPVHASRVALYLSRKFIWLSFVKYHLIEPWRHVYKYALELSVIQSTSSCSKRERGRFYAFPIPRIKLSSR